MSNENRKFYIIRNGDGFNEELYERTANGIAEVRADILTIDELIEKGQDDDYDKQVEEFEKLKAESENYVKCSHCNSNLDHLECKTVKEWYTTVNCDESIETEEDCGNNSVFTAVCPYCKMRLDNIDSENDAIEYMEVK